MHGEVTRWYIQAVWETVQHLHMHGVPLDRASLMEIAALCNMITVTISMPGHFLSMRSTVLLCFDDDGHGPSTPATVV